MEKPKMSQFHKTPDGAIDYDFYKEDANRLRREARSRFVSSAVAAICFPFRQLMRFAAAWQAAWPSPATRGTETWRDHRAHRRV
jgi:hypothetical protein